ncbi:MAG: SDR family oxidoreductase [Candidatus Kapabacteria bacterium]|nr:SDR family oxidoreductase [Candidatus Kapabacteria bacterium]
MKINLEGKHAVVCGSTQGIGKASAIQLANIGATITLIARDEEKLIETCNELNTHFGQKHNYIVADFSKPVELIKTLEFVNLPVLILVNNTGGPNGGPIMNAKIEDFESAFTNHLKCNHLLVQKFAPGMIVAHYGRIINIISTSVKAPLPNLGVSNTIRGAVASWGKTLASELGIYGITVNNVLPGATLTQRLKNIIDTKAGGDPNLASEIEESMIREIPARRFAEPIEIANAVAFLASPAASYINGINLPVDGGRLMSL